MWLFLPMVRDSNHDDNDPDLSHGLHATRRDYAIVSENDGLEGPASGPLPIGLALMSYQRPARSRRGGQMQLSFIHNPKMGELFPTGRQSIPAPQHSPSSFILIP